MLNWPDKFFLFSFQLFQLFWVWHSLRFLRSPHASVHDAFGVKTKSPIPKLLFHSNRRRGQHALFALPTVKRRITWRSRHRRRPSSRCPAYSRRPPTRCRLKRRPPNTRRRVKSQRASSPAMTWSHRIRSRSTAANTASSARWSSSFATWSIAVLWLFRLCDAAAYRRATWTAA